MYSKDFRQRAWKTLAAGRFGKVFLFALILSLITSAVFMIIATVYFNSTDVAQRFSDAMYALTNVSPNDQAAFSQAFEEYMDALMAFAFGPERMIFYLIVSAGFVLLMFAMLAQQWLYLETAREKTVTAGGFFSKLKLALSSFWLAFMVFIRIWLWSLLLIIPGIIKAFSYYMAFFIKLDNPEMSANRCIAESVRMMDGNKARLFILLLSFIGWYILAGIVLGIANFIFGLFPIGEYIYPVLVSLVITPVAVYQMTAVAVFYRDLKGEDPFGLNSQPRQSMADLADVFGGLPPDNGPKLP